MRFLVRCAAVAVLSGACPVAGAADQCAEIPSEKFRSQEGTAFEKVRIKADEIDFPGRNVVVLRGYAQLFRGGHRVNSDELIYYKARNTAEARGSVTLRTQKGDVVRTNVLAYDIASGMAVSGPAEFTIANRSSKVLGTGDNTVNAYGTAARVTFESADIMLLEVADVTSCLDGKKDITFHAEKLRLDLNEGVRTVKSAAGNGASATRVTGTRVKVTIANPGKHKKLEELKNLID